MDIFNQFGAELDKIGSRFSIISVDHIHELESEIVKRYQDSQIGEQVYSKYINDYFDFSIKNKWPFAETLILTATPSLQVNVTFRINGSPVTVHLPPTYTDKKDVYEIITGITTRLFDPNGFHTYPMVLPKKLLAVRSGLARYGRNNICYVNGMGSFSRLTLFASDIPCPKDDWQEPLMLEKCHNCRLCIQNCPTGAIAQNRFVIDASRCLTFYNEQPEPFPDWIESNYHNSLIGCMKCQSICPENRDYRHIVDHNEEFSGEETRMIQDDIPFEELPEVTQEKLNRLCMKPWYGQLARNLSVLG